MHIIRYLDRATRTVHVGVDRGGEVSPLDVRTLGELLSRPLDEIRALVERTDTGEHHRPEITLLPPADGRIEVWAAGVTYRRSKDARVEESLLSQVYELVYDAPRPELFFKSVPWRVVTDGEPIAVRRDSPLNVPEAELALAVNARGEMVGYAVCNDVSSRSIEGANPIYLPQAKIYAGSCALSTGIRPIWEIGRADDLTIDVTVHRKSEPVWSGSTSTAHMRRTFEDLVGCLFEEQQFPDGVIISTGTGAVPPIDFTLLPGDVVKIQIDQIGTLTNPVVSGKTSFGWLAKAALDPFTRSAGGSGLPGGR